MEKKIEKSECKHCAELQDKLNQRYYADLEREKAFRELNEKFNDKQREIEEYKMAIKRRENTIMFLCGMLVREGVHTKSYGTSLNNILDDYYIVIENIQKD